MTPDPITTTLDTDVRGGGADQGRAGFGHLPALDEKGQVAGVVSLRRVVAATTTSPSKLGAVSAQSRDASRTGVARTANVNDERRPTCSPS